MKNLLFIAFCIVCIFQQILTMQKLPKKNGTNSSISQQDSFLEKIKNIFAQEKYLREQKDWENFYLNLYISKKEHTKMIEYLGKENYDNALEKVLTQEEQEWFKELEEKNPRAFTAFLYYEALDAVKSKSIAHNFCDECLNCILF